MIFTEAVFTVTIIEGDGTLSAKPDETATLLQISEIQDGKFTINGGSQNLTFENQIMYITLSETKEYYSETKALSVSKNRYNEWTIENIEGEMQHGEKIR